MVTVYTVYAALAVIHNQTVTIDQTFVPHTNSNVTVYKMKNFNLIVLLNL